MFQKLNPSPPEDGSSVALADKYSFLGCRATVLEETDLLFMPVTSQVYEQLMINPSAAKHYLKQVEDFEKHLSTVPVEKVVPVVPVVPEPLPLPDVPEVPFEPIGLAPPEEPKGPLRPFMLKPVDTADVLISAKGAALIRKDTDPQRIAPTVSIMGLNKDFLLDVEFDVQLSAAQPSVILRSTDALSVSSLWIRNPQHGFTYGLER